MQKTNNGLWLSTGITVGVFVGMGLLHIFETYQENTTPSEVVCSKGMAFEQASYGASVYLKTDTECLDTDIIMGGE
jgi:hypothetical protein|tara:strand:+ start:478 stop:705 length:228 start_codon:yes stop_codon:yes gene_type:complete